VSLKRQFLRRLPNWLPRAQSDSAADPADLYFAYRLLLGRRPDAGGWKHWSEQMPGGMTCQQLVSSFLSSTEFRRRYRLRKTTRVQVEGFSIFVDENDHGVSSSIIHGKTYESHVTNALRRELKSDSVLLDVGCSIGWFVLLAASLAPDGKVIGIEPNETNRQLLYRSIAANRFENVVVLPYAASDKRALLQLGYDAAQGFVHGLDGASDDPFVQAAAIDELLKDEPRIDVVKMDIEGHEPVALRGMVKTLERFRPLLLSEFHPKLMRDHAGCDPAGYFDALLRLGYHISVLTPEGDQIPQASASELMNYWKSVNERHQTDDTMHLDLLARM
jgi:FkbM family methyltransferase